mmetsp:Transcript_44672/g.59263  ORF Transcript_44672/g.59263 Transcript_44672/m.59263 type:complete len:102 (-) Transcript_44672:728-1033(-)
MQREAKMANASEASDIETVKPSNVLFSVDVNLENLQMHLDHIRGILKHQDTFLNSLDKRVNERATEKIMGQYLERMSHAIPKTLGTRPHAFKLDDPTFFEQ